MSETRAEHEDLEIIKELVGKSALLTKTGHRITFKSENIKHEVMTDFVIHCLRTDKNYESYLKLTSEDSVIEYCTFWEYRNLTNERCLYIPKFLEDLLMEKLKILAVLYNKNIWYTGIDKEKISRTYDIPLAVFDIDDVALLARFVEFVIQKGIDRANLNSILCSIFIFHQTVRSEDDFHKGSHEHFSDKSRVLPYNLLRRARQLYLSPKNDPESRDTDVLNQQMYIDGGIQNLSLSPKEWAILIFILLADDYLITIDRLSETKERSMQQAFPLLQDVTLLSDIEYMTQLGKYDNVLTIDKDKRIIRFASDEIRHQVMSYFVLNCLKTDEDYKNYIRLSSVDSLLEYVRRWWPERVGKERCLYLTGTLERTIS
ncbi:uncharacterized protein LOC130053354 [Ostrea edulis]|uniref:uncharacterized protein LOC130053354 n=1 Tax=Ostrea edulis TaxID=37623 RepID=UPI0024AE902D|nr:uncharacterized protein LOC130053354 [Ostrea edulis]